MRTVLIVDDEPVALEGLRRGVDWERLGVTAVLTAESLRDAQQVFRSGQPDLMICDIEMPNGSGLDLAAWVGESHPGVDTIFLTCHADFVYAQRALKLGGADYLLKPIPYRDLESAILRLFRKRESEARVTIPSDSSQTGDARSSGPALPDMTLWSMLLFSGGGDAVRAQARDFLDVLGRSVAPDPGIMHRFRQDFMQAVYSFFRSKRIPIHELFGDQVSIRLEARAMSDIPALYSWVEHVLDRVDEGVDENEDETSDIGRAERYIRRHITDDLTCSRIASYVSLHPDTLTRLFKKERECTVSEYVFREKMRVARNLLEHTDLPIGDIAARLGYANFSHFSALFKKRETLSPARYRAERRNSGNPESLPE